jgi:hypothetical protein
MDRMSIDNSIIIYGLYDCLAAVYTLLHADDIHKRSLATKARKFVQRALNSPNFQLKIKRSRYLNLQIHYICQLNRKIK